MTPQCPKCGKYFTKRVFMEGAEDPLSTVAGMFAYRCQLCSELFRAKKPEPLLAAAPQLGGISELTNLTRRQYVRVACNFPVTCVISKIKPEGTVTEIALGGCTLQADVVLAIGAKLRMELNISDTEPPLVIHEALVRSVRPAGFGIQFMEILDAEKERLGRLLEKLLARLIS